MRLPTLLLLSSLFLLLLSSPFTQANTSPQDSYNNNVDNYYNSGVAPDTFSSEMGYEVLSPHSPHQQPPPSFPSSFDRVTALARLFRNKREQRQARDVVDVISKETKKEITYENEPLHSAEKTNKNNNNNNEAVDGPPSTLLSVENIFDPSLEISPASSSSSPSFNANERFSISTIQATGTPLFLQGKQQMDRRGGGRGVEVRELREGGGGHTLAVEGPSAPALYPMIEAPSAIDYLAITPVNHNNNYNYVNNENDYNMNYNNDSPSPVFLSPMSKPSVPTASAEYNNINNNIKSSDHISYATPFPLHHSPCDRGLARTGRLVRGGGGGGVLGGGSPLIGNGHLRESLQEMSERVRGAVIARKTWRRQRRAERSARREERRGEREARREEVRREREEKKKYFGLSPHYDAGYYGTFAPHGEIDEATTMFDETTTTSFEEVPTIGAGGAGGAGGGEHVTIGVITQTRTTTTIFPTAPTTTILPTAPTTTILPTAPTTTSTTIVPTVPSPTLAPSDAMVPHAEKPPRGPRGIFDNLYHSWFSHGYDQYEQTYEVAEVIPPVEPVPPVVVPPVLPTLFAPPEVKPMEPAYWPMPSGVYEREFAQGDMDRSLWDKCETDPTRFAGSWTLQLNKSDSITGILEALGFGRMKRNIVANYPSTTDVHVKSSNPKHQPTLQMITHLPMGIKKQGTIRFNGQSVRQPDSDTGDWQTVPYFVKGRAMQKRVNSKGIMYDVRCAFPSDPLGRDRGRFMLFQWTFIPRGGAPLVARRWLRKN